MRCKNMLSLTERPPISSLTIREDRILVLFMHILEGHVQLEVSELAL